MRNILVVGASRGIGFELVKQLSAGKLHKIIATVRTPSAQLSELAAKSEGRVKIEMLEMTSAASAKALAQAIPSAYQPLHEIIINAGAQVKGDTNGCLLSSKTVEQDMIDLFRINTVGPVVALQALVPLIQRLGEGSEHGRVVLMSSILASCTLNRSDAIPIYSLTKTALNMVGVKLAAELSDQGISVLMLHPGWVQTDMGGPNASISAETSVQGMLKVLQDDEKAGMPNTAEFKNYKGETLAW